MLQKILQALARFFFGPGQTAFGPQPHGIGPFIQSSLRYGALFPRLGIAVVAWALCAWLLKWRIPAGFAFLAVEVYASLLVIRALTDLFRLRNLGRILVSMWLPIAIIAIAVYLLFFNDQGRELGIGLMDRTPNAFYLQKGLYLGLALVYWAFNNWLSARIGLSRVFRSPERDQSLLFWGPRLLGVCAHLLAAVSLSVAAWKQPNLQGERQLALVLAAPIAISLATVFALLLDKAYVSHRFLPEESRQARKAMFGVAAVELLVLIYLVYESNSEKQPGLSLAALWITGSALFFLILISLLRRKAPLGPNATAGERLKDERDEQRQTVHYTYALALVMGIATVAVWLWPMHIGQFFGSLTIACFSFGAFLALVNFLDLLASKLASYARQSGFHLMPRAVWAALLCFLVLPALLASLTHVFHRVRICKSDDTTCTPVAAAGWAPVATPGKRPTVAEAARAWYVQAAPVYHALHPNEPVPMLIVATAGGGIRAAYWTATIMEKLEGDLRWDALGAQTGDKPPPSENLLRNLLFAISGVSGGSVGAAAYAAAVHDHEVNQTAITPTAYLQKDFLAPGLASMVFVDGVANLLPDFGQIDRGQALELGFETASSTARDPDGLVSHTFLSFLPTMDEVKRIKSWRPALLLNATHQETGRRIITSHIKIERNIFLDSYDALQVLGADLRLSTAAHNSARFTYISPAGDLISANPDERWNKGYVIDGGYFENYGAETALELARNAIKAINESEPKGGNKVKLVLLQISSDPTLKKDRTLVRVARLAGSGTCTVNTFGTAGPDNYLALEKDEGEGYVLSYANELSAPIVGIMSVREAHGTLAAEELAAASCQEKNERNKVAQTPPNAVQLDTSGSTPGNTTGAALPAVGAVDNTPHFSHLAMCAPSWNSGAGIDPPLGWVLSDLTRSKFKDILADCDNGTELVGLEAALGVRK